MCGHCFLKAPMETAHPFYLGDRRVHGDLYVSSRLPIDSFDEHYESFDTHISTLAHDAALLVHCESWREDPWLRNLDWSIDEVEYTEGKESPNDDGTYLQGLTRRLVSHLQIVPLCYLAIFCLLFSYLLFVI